MEWNESKCYLMLQESQEYLKNSLGISQLDIDTSRTMLLPYFVQIVKYINGKLITLASDSIKAKVELIFDIFNDGADLICTESTIDLVRLVEVDMISEHYDQDRFVFSWTNLLSTLCLRLKFQYAYLFEPDYDGECCKCGTPGQTTTDFESWTSGVYSEDEEYDRTNYTRTNSAWQVSKDRYCDCYRRDKQD